MPRNDIALIVGLIVTVVVLLAGPAGIRGLPRSPKAVATALVIFVVAFLVTWIILRLLGI